MNMKKNNTETVNKAAGPYVVGWGSGVCEGANALTFLGKFFQIHAVFP